MQGLRHVPYWGGGKKSPLCELGSELRLRGIRSRKGDDKWISGIRVPGIGGGGVASGGPAAAHQAPLRDANTPTVRVARSTPSDAQNRATDA